MATDDLTFLELTDMAGIEWSPAQREFARVAFCGLPPSPSSIGKKLWGFEEAPTKLHLRIVGAVCGREAGKSLLAGCRAVHLACTVDLSPIRHREVAVCPVVSTDIDTARQVVRFALGLCEELGIPTTNLIRDGEDGFSIIRSNGKLVNVMPKSATIGGRNVRGRSLVCVVLDEIAFFRDSRHKVNDIDIFDALKSRIMPGGQMILLSSPWTESGLLYDFWKRNYEHPKDGLIAWAPTSLMRSDRPDILEIIEMERETDPEKCARERDASFMTVGANQFFDPRAVQQSIVSAMATDAPQQTVAVGGDFAFTRNSSAFVAARVYQDKDAERPIYEVIGLKEMRPKGRPLKPSVVCRDAANFAKKIGVEEIIADGYSREAVAEHLEKHEITHIIAPAGSNAKQETFGVVRALFHEGRLRIPSDIDGSELVDKLMRQIKEVSGRPVQGGRVEIESPLWRSGEHGDLVSALVVALWRLSRLGPDAPDEEDDKDFDEYERAWMAEAAEKRQKVSRSNRRLTKGLY